MFFRKNKKKNFSAVPQNYIYTKAQKRSKKLIFLFIFYMALFFGFVGAVAYFIFFTPYFQIQNTAFYGMNFIKEDALKQISGKYFAIKKYDFLDQRNLLAMSSSGLSEAFKSELRRVKNVTIDKEFPNKVSISIEEYLPAGISCSGAEENIKCFYFDEYGTVFEEAPFIIGEVLLLVRDESINTSSFPEQKYDENFVKFISNFKKDFSKSGFAIEYFATPNKFGDIDAMSSSGFKILLSQNQTPEEQAKAVLEILNSQTENAQNIDYIDLRIKNRAYFKLKSVPVPSQEVPTQSGI